MRIQHILSGLIVAWGLGGVVANVAVAQPVTSLKIGDGSGWQFTSGPWTEAADGVISPPDKRNLHSRAFSTVQSFGDLTAEFEFNCDPRETMSGGVGLVFRATDANHFYAVYFPWVGQQLRTKSFWATIVKVDGDGYLRSLKSAFVPGVPSEIERWYKVRLEVKGPNMEVWVDGRRALSVSDDSYKSGAVGMVGYGWYFFRNINITGQQGPAVAWDAKQKVPVHNFTVGLDSQAVPSGCIAPNGDVLLAAGSKLVRSKDKGHTWDPPEILPEKIGKVQGGNTAIFCTAQGRLIVRRCKFQKPASEISIAESTDNGVTWSDPVPAKMADGWPTIHPNGLEACGPPIETEDGTLVQLFHAGLLTKVAEPQHVWTWGSFHCKSYAIRSTDGGKSWSAPADLDRPMRDCSTPRGSIIGALDFVEPVGVAIGNKVTVLIRPIHSHLMWQCWSDDAGATWDAAARATFAGYAASMVRTKSGAILIGHRYPHYSVHVSRDNGLNWDDGAIIDYPAWAMGCAVEVEPDVVLFAYMNANQDMPLLAQLIRVTSSGIEPVNVKK